MSATGLNHVSLQALDVDDSIRFYEGVLGMIRVPSFQFVQPVVWMRFGSVQLHLFERADAIPTYQHVGLEVDDFETVYRAVRQRKLLDDTFGHHCYELPDGSVQLYFRDPAGNLIEVDWPDARNLDRLVVNDIRLLSEDVPQAAGIDASLFLNR